MPDAVVASVVCALAVGGLLAAERVGSRAGRFVAKPLASTAFVVAALGNGALHGGYGRWLLVALLLSWVGDVLLMFHAQAAFLAGLGAFLLGHLAFAAAFVARGVALPWVLGALVVLVPPLVGIGRWLLPHVPRGMKGPVLAYMAVITAMVACAAGSYGHDGAALVPLAAVAFYLSDLSVARQRFVAPGYGNLVWGLPLYYGAQILFCFTL